MAEILSTTAITSEIEKLLKEGRGEKVILITPYIKMSDRFRRRIEDLDKFQTPVFIIVREGENHDASNVSFLQELDNVNLKTIRNLHAKCYINHKTAILASMNLYEFSQENNIELGIKIDKESDIELFNQIEDEVQEILRGSNPFEYEIKKVSSSKNRSNGFGKPKYYPKSDNKQKPKSGFCIRCGKPIDFDIKHPLCDKCYPIWAKYKDENFPEKVCHACGKAVPSHKSSYKKPVCYNCYKKINS